jgi:hypothetical protein
MMQVAMQSLIFAYVFVGLYACFCVNVITWHIREINFSVI